jgi:8-oxo-dGTP pyrophosphatase MutT (NUDIX family)
MTPPVPRPSTTVLLVRDGADGLEVLMVVRNAQAHFASALVFPGGVIDQEDADEVWLELIDGGADLDVAERARRIAGFRELYEETGVLLLDAPDQRPQSGGPAAFVDVVRQSGGRLDLSAMAPFAHWVTPERAAKRFDTHFRLCWITTEMIAISDGSETVSAEWLRPEQAISLGASGERRLLFPTKCQLDLLAQAQTVEAAVAEARARRIIPVMPALQKRPEGTFLTIPEEAGYPVHDFPMSEPRT